MIVLILLIAFKIFLSLNFFLLLFFNLIAFFLLVEVLDGIIAFVNILFLVYIFVVIVGNFFELIIS